MKKKLVLLILTISALSIGVIGCGKNVNTTNNDINTNIQVENEIDVTPTQEVVNETTFENTYWINNDLQMAYYFENGVANSAVMGVETKVDYTLDENTIVMGEHTLNYTIENEILTLNEESGVSITFNKGTIEDYNNFIEENLTTDSKYVGLTVKEFVDKGANIQSSMGINGSYQFSGTNEVTGEYFTFTVNGDVGTIMENKTLDDEYVDIIGDFVIETIEIQVVNEEELQKYVGKTISEFEIDGYEINGFSYIENLILYANDNMTTIEITLDESANETYLALEDTFNADMGEIFADYNIISISYM